MVKIIFPNRHRSGGEIMLEDIENLDIDILLQLQEFYPELFEELENL